MIMIIMLPPAFSHRKQNWLSFGPQSPASYRSFDHSSGDQGQNGMI